MARERHIDRPVFRLATRLCIVCGCTLLYAIPFHQVPHVWSDDVLDKAMESHVCTKALPKPRAAWGVKR